VEEDNNLFGTSDNQIKNTNISQQNNTVLDFEKQISNYFKNNKVKLYILTPCFSSLCYTNYVVCLMGTIELFRNFGIQLKVEFCKNDSLVSRARNNLIARAMTDKDATHFLFIDNDITWNPVDILKLIMANKELVGGIYPLKNYDWNKLVKDNTNPYNSNIIQSLLKKKNSSQLAGVVSDSAMIQHNLLRYNINYLGQFLEINNNLAKVKHLATGFMMIKRNLIQNMMKAFPSTKYVDDVNFLKPEENEMAYALFDCGVEDGHYYSEDWLFCDRWSKMGGDIYVDVSINLTHTGIEDYNGCYVSTII
jgi:acyl-CoA synthetase (AMP-forming)/AMP-acid ligase II